jgi:hypothetical protein
MMKYLSFIIFIVSNLIYLDFPVLFIVVYPLRTWPDEKAVHLRLPGKKCALKRQQQQVDENHPDSERGPLN